MGVFEGRPTGEGYRAESALSANQALPKGESRDDVARRVRRLLASLAPEDGPTVVVTHGDVIREALRLWAASGTNSIPETVASSDSRLIQNIFLKGAGLDGVVGGGDGPCRVLGTALYLHRFDVLDRPTVEVAGPAATRSKANGKGRGRWPQRRTQYGSDLLLGRELIVTPSGRMRD